MNTRNEKIIKILDNSIYLFEDWSNDIMTENDKFDTLRDINNNDDEKTCTNIIGKQIRK